MTIKRSISSSFFLLALVACSKRGLETSSPAGDLAIRNQYFGEASAGDAEAEYQVGESYCCSSEYRGGVVYSVQAATEWFCKAAHQDHARAQLRLGMIYEGDVVDKLAADAVGGSAVPAVEVNLLAAAVWYTLASHNGNDEARERLPRVLGWLSEYEKRALPGIVVRWRELPCEYDDVRIDETKFGTYLK